MLHVDAPVKFIDQTKPEAEFPKAPCVYTNYVEIDSVFPHFKGEIIDVEEYVPGDYYIIGQIEPVGTYGQFSMKLTSRPTKNAIYKFKSGEVTPKTIEWYWSPLGNRYYPYEGELFVDVLPDGKVKFTWCELVFQRSSFPVLRPSRGSFILD
jgi:hypothetical protein